MIGYKPPSTWDYVWIDLRGLWYFIALYLVLLVAAIVRLRRHPRPSKWVALGTSIGLFWMIAKPTGRFIAPEVFRLFARSLEFALTVSIGLIGVAVFLDRPHRQKN